MVVAVTAVFHENNKYYPQVFVGKCPYKLWITEKSYVMIELMFLKELILKKQANQKNVIFVTIGIF